MHTAGSALNQSGALLFTYVGTTTLRPMAMISRPRFARSKRDLCFAVVIFQIRITDNIPPQYLHDLNMVLSDKIFGNMENVYLTDYQITPFCQVDSPL